MANLELKPQVWLAANGTEYELRVEWNLTIGRWGEIKNLFAHTASVTGAIRTGDPEIGEVMAGLQAALAEVPADIAKALMRRGKAEAQAEA